MVCRPTCLLELEVLGKVFFFRLKDPAFSRLPDLSPSVVERGSRTKFCPSLPVFLWERQCPSSPSALPRSLPVSCSAGKLLSPNSAPQVRLTASFQPLNDPDPALRPLGIRREPRRLPMIGALCGCKRKVPPWRSFYPSSRFF